MVIHANTPNLIVAIEDLGISLEEQYLKNGVYRWYYKTQKSNSKLSLLRISNNPKQVVYIGDTERYPSDFDKPIVKQILALAVLHDYEITVY